MRSPIKRYGGKGHLAKHIVPLMPPHTTYVEPFGGGASVLLAKPVSDVEIYNDLDSTVYNIFYQLRDNPAMMQRILQLTPYSEEEFAHCTDGVRFTTEHARQDIVRLRQSFAAAAKSWSFSVGQARRDMAQCVSGWWSAIENLPEVIDRLRRVQLFNRDALDVIDTCDTPDTLFYCDPPYVKDTRESGEVYLHEMSSEQHQALCERLRRCKGKVILSGYDSPLYRMLLYDWRRVDIEVNNHASKSQKRTTEVLWLNWSE